MEQPLDLAFLKDRYDYELDRKDKLTASLTLPVGILTGLGGLLAVMFRSFTSGSRSDDPVLGFPGSRGSFIRRLPGVYRTRLALQRVRIHGVHRHSRPHPSGV